MLFGMLPTVKNHCPLIFIIKKIFLGKNIKGNSFTIYFTALSQESRRKEVKSQPGVSRSRVDLLDWPGFAGPTFQRIFTYIRTSFRPESAGSWINPPDRFKFQNYDKKLRFQLKKKWKKTFLTSQLSIKPLL
jgi:hypothetical protein